MNHQQFRQTVRADRLLYAFRSRIKTKTEKLEESEKRYGRKVVSLLDEVIHDLECVSSNILRHSAIMKSNTDSLLIAILKAKHYLWRENVYMSVLIRTTPCPPMINSVAFWAGGIMAKGRKNSVGSRLSSGWVLPTAGFIR